MIAKFISIAFLAILSENFVLVKFLGICPFLGVSKKTSTAVGMGMAVTFVMVFASTLTYLTYYYVLVPIHAEYLQTLAFILVIAFLVQFVEMFVAKTVPSLYSALGIYLPLITTNCAVLSVTLLNVEKEYNFAFSLLYGVTAGLGFTLAIILMAGIRERLDERFIPKAFRGFPTALITAGLMALAFMGFSGLSF